MALTLCLDTTPADWIARSSLPWQRLVTFGPAGFERYGRLRLLPDPAHPAQSEAEAGAGPEADARHRADQLPVLLEVLAGHTSTPEDCCSCVWTGSAHAPSPPPPGVPQVVVPHRAYWLFRGPLRETGAWDTAEGWPGPVRLGAADPAFVWPRDRAWCVALDVDPHWAGVGCSAAALDSLVSDPRLDVVAADPTAEQPAYR